jgi:XTP/dITP diphosphohydrolase
MELVVATKNKKKLQEIKDILKGLDVRVTSVADYPGAPRVIENGRNFKENAAKKAMIISRFAKKFTLGEDSGLCIDALGGKPGIYSSRFAGKNKSDAMNNAKVLKLMENVPAGKRGAHYVAAVALADRDGLLGVAEGKCYGRIGFDLKGTCGFGYDPLFVIPKYGKTFAQLGERIKHKMSHRYHALEKARRIIEKYIEKEKDR